jgi:hypothetical protein
MNERGGMKKLVVLPESAAAFHAAVERSGMTGIAVASRLAEWFVGLPQPLQREIIQSMWPEPAPTDPALIKAVLLEFLREQ